METHRIGRLAGVVAAAAATVTGTVATANTAGYITHEALDTLAPAQRLTLDGAPHEMPETLPPASGPGRRAASSSSPSRTKPATPT